MNVQLSARKISSSGGSHKLLRRSSTLSRSAYCVIALPLFFLLTSCQNSVSEIRDYSTLDRDPILEAEKIDMTLTEKGEVVVRMQAPSMRSYDREDNKYDEFREGIYIQSYTSSGVASSSIRAEYAIYQRESKLWEARTHVVAVNEKGDSIQTEQIFWDENQGRVYSNTNVRIRTSTSVLYGKGLESDDRFVNWEIKEPTGIIAIENISKTSGISSQQFQPAVQ